MNIGPSEKNASIRPNAMRCPVAVRALAPSVRTCSAAAIAAYFCRPNRPAGLIMSTIAMMMKMTVLDASG
ncbi:hypothetical protein D3C83_174580 [compost metagenome]